MSPAELTEAILFLCPNAEFSFEAADYSTINWIVLEGNPPTLDEIENAHKNLKKIEIEKFEEIENKKIAAQSKLASLGLTVDDLKVLGLA